MQGLLTIPRIEVLWRYEVIDFELTEEQTMLRNMIREFAEREVIPVIRNYERQFQFPFEIVARMASLGMLGGPIPQQYGGMGVDWITHAVISEEIGRISFSLCIAIPIAHTSLVEMSILNWGNEEQRQSYLPRLTRGEMIGCFATVEPNVGSDGVAIEARAELDGDQWVLDGTKIWITNGSIADLAIITARTEEGITAFLVEKGTPGFSVTRIEGVMGIHSASESELNLTQCRIPRQNLLGKVGKGFHIALSSISIARYSIAAGCTGIAQGCVDACVKYAQERYQFGKPIGSFQLVQGIIADMVVETEAARFLTYRAGYLKDRDLPNARETSIAKYYATEAALRASTNAIRLHGAYGYSDASPVERYHRDAMGAIIFGGTNEIQKLIIGRDVLGISAFV